MLVFRGVIIEVSGLEGGWTLRNTRDDTFENRSFVTRRASMDLDQLILFGRFGDGISGPGLLPR